MKKRPKWPIPHYDEDQQPHFLFILTPPYCGSTAMSKLINTSPRAMILQERGEGQWLIPGLHEESRWNPEKEINYNSLKAVWLKRYQLVRQLTQLDIDVVIEKSPTNMVRIEKIVSLFKDYSFLANNRNPYASCSSVLYREHDTETLNPEQRQSILKKSANTWLNRSSRLKELIHKYNIPLLTYESFCETPSSIMQKLNLPEGVAESIDPKAEIKVKDYEVQTITNYNEKQMSRLTSNEIAAISSVLEPHLELLNFFGYELYTP